MSAGLPKLVAIKDNQLDVIAQTTAQLKTAQAMDDARTGLSYENSKPKL